MNILRFWLNVQFDGAKLQFFQALAFLLAIKSTLASPKYSRSEIKEKNTCFFCVFRSLTRLFVVNNVDNLSEKTSGRLSDANLQRDIP